MNGIPFIYNIPKKSFFSAIYPSFSVTSKKLWSIMDHWCTEHPYFTTTLYSSQSSNSAVWMSKVNAFTIESRMRNIEKRFVTVALLNFSIIIRTKIRSYLNSSFHCNWVNVIRHVDSILVRSLPPNSLNES